MGISVDSAGVPGLPACKMEVWADWRAGRPVAPSGISSTPAHSKPVPGQLNIGKPPYYSPTVFLQRPATILWYQNPNMGKASKGLLDDDDAGDAIEEATLTLGINPEYAARLEVRYY